MESFELWLLRENIVNDAIKLAQGGVERRGRPPKVLPIRFKTRAQYRKQLTKGMKMTTQFALQDRIRHLIQGGIDPVVAIARDNRIDTSAYVDNGRVNDIVLVCAEPFRADSLVLDNFNTVVMCPSEECLCLRPLTRKSRLNGRVYIYPLYTLLTDSIKLQAIDRLVSKSRQGFVLGDDRIMLQGFVSAAMDSPLPALWGDSRWNSSQRQAIQHAIQNKLTLVRGPPGTGKTETACAILHHLKNKYGRVLVSSPGNVAVSNIVQRVYSGDTLSVGQYCVVLGSPNNIKQEIRQFSLHAMVDTTIETMEDVHQNYLDYASHPRLNALIRTLPVSPPGLTDALQTVSECGDLKAIRRAAGCTKSSNCATSPRHRTVPEIIYEWRSRTNVSRHVLGGASIIACTLCMCGSKLLSEMGIKAVVIDEASQANEADTLIPLRSAVENLTLIGDPTQLTSLVRSPAARAILFHRSTMARLYEGGFPTMLLDTQYRMHPKIASVPSALFYDGRLKTAESTTLKLRRHKKPVRLIDVRGAETHCKRTKSLMNKSESVAVHRLVKSLCPSLAAEAAADQKRVVVITPYQGHKQLLESMLGGLCEVHTIDAFQGHEADIVVLSLVRSSSDSGKNTGVGFMSDRNRINVAITRAKERLYIVCDKALFLEDPTWKRAFTMWGLVQVDRRSSGVYADTGERS